MSTSPDEPLIPVRMLNEFVYCPRLAWLEWIDGDFEDNADTIEGRYRHRRVDRASGQLTSGDTEDPQRHGLQARSVLLSDSDLGLIGRIDVVEENDGQLVPVDTKRGRPPPTPERAWPPERVQVCAQVLLLRAHGWRSDHGYLYFSESRERVEVPVDAELERMTRDAIRGLRRLAQESQPPPPLIDSPKCNRCSLASICLPDEVNLLSKSGGADEPRPLRAPAHPRRPLHVSQPGATIALSADLLDIRVSNRKVDSARIRELSHVSLYGGVHMTTPALRQIVARGIPVCHFTSGGWFQAITVGMPHKNVELRQRQFRAADDPDFCVSISRNIVQAKIRNARTLLRRNAREDRTDTLRRMRQLAHEASRTCSLASLLGVEGSAARAYFQAFSSMLKVGLDPSFDFEKRNRRPPLDPTNALLSFLYSVLTRDATLAVLSCGLDPFLGFYHQPRYGRPALGLDLCEEFRPIVADSVVIGLLNNGEVGADHFIVRSTGCNLTPEGRRAVLKAYERRLGQEIKHPIFRYTLTYRQVIEVQARLLAKHLLGEIPAYVPFTTR